jgi:hypothetical protein
MMIREELSLEQRFCGEAIGYTGSSRLCDFEKSGINAMDSVAPWM